jgi:hypothetical protein
MLNTIATVMTPQDTVTTTSPVTPKTSRFQKVLNKPSALGKSTNAKAGQLSIVEKLDSLTSDEVENMSDAQVRAIEEALQNDELTDGVTW